VYCVKLEVMFECQRVERVMQLIVVDTVLRMLCVSDMHVDIGGV